MAASSSSGAARRCGPRARPCAGTGPGPWRVAGGAVAAGQLVELVQKVAGVADVAAHGAVRPAHPVGVEAQVQLDQRADRLDVLGGVAQGPHPVAGHPGADHLVVVEHHRPPRPERTGLGLAHVVEQRGQAHQAVGPGLFHHGDGVGQHVLVAVDGVLLQGQGRQLGEELLGQPGPHQEPQPLPGVGTTMSLSSSSRMRSSETMSRRARRRMTASTSSGSGTQPVAGDEPGGPQHPQRVVGEGLLGRQRGPQPPGGQVADPVERVDQLRSGSERAMALTVKSRRDRSASMASAKTTSGLRESAW